MTCRRRIRKGRELLEKPGRGVDGGGFFYAVAFAKSMEKEAWPEGGGGERGID